MIVQAIGNHNKTSSPDFPPTVGEVVVGKIEAKHWEEVLSACFEGDASLTSSMFSPSKRRVVKMVASPLRVDADPSDTDFFSCEMHVRDICGDVRVVVDGDKEYRRG